MQQLPIQTNKFADRFAMRQTLDDEKSKSRYDFQSVKAVNKINMFKAVINLRLMEIRFYFFVPDSRAHGDIALQSPDAESCM